MTTEKRDVYTRITDKIIADLEKGVRTWMKPWNASNTAGRITRPLRSNGIPYSGINILMLWAESVTKGYTAPLWKSCLASRTTKTLLFGFLAHTSRTALFTKPCIHACLRHGTQSGHLSMYPMDP